MSKEAMKLALEAAYLAGFYASGEGYNGEYPFNDQVCKPQNDANWVKNRDDALREALAEQPAQQQESVAALQRVMARLADLLDEDQFAEIEGIVARSGVSPPAQRKPLPFNKEDMEGLDVNQRLGFKLGWKSAEAAHNIKENT